MLISDLKEKEALYEVVEPRYFEKAESLSEQDDQGAIYEFLLKLVETWFRGLQRVAIGT